MQHVLRVDDALPGERGGGEVARLRVGAQHRVAEQQQHQGRRHQAPRTAAASACSRTSSTISQAAAFTRK
jgi:hypothetical protein